MMTMMTDWCHREGQYYDDYDDRLALRNTQLLQMCGADRRVRLLVFAVRYWGKWKQVAGNQNCGPRLSNYCLTLLALFYLANTSPPVLPSVQALADLAGETGVWDRVDVCVSVCVCVCVCVR